MTYSKPEVKTLGEATTVIEQVGKVQPTIPEPPRNLTFKPAYDLDE